MADATSSPPGGRSPAIDTGTCLNRRHSGAACAECVDACPHGALRLESGSPTVITGLCTGCGLCTAACPTGAISDDRRQERRLLATCASLPAGAVTIVCTRHPAPESAIGDSDAVVIHGRCLGALTPELLLDLGEVGRRRLWLDDARCDACEVGAGESVRRAAGAAAAVLSAFGHSARISCRESSTAEPDPRRPVVDASTPAVSRRVLFRELALTTARVREEAEVLTAHAGDGVHVAPTVSRHRRRLLEHLAVLANSAPPEVLRLPHPTAALPVGAVEIADACSACGVCTRFCPTGALKPAEGTSTQGETEFVLSFRSALCIDCALCAVACPEAAVSFAPTITAESMAAEAWTPIFAAELLPCADCGAPTRRGDGDAGTRCSFCRSGPGAVTPLRDDAGLMADLLRRRDSPA